MSEVAYRERQIERLKAKVERLTRARRLTFAERTQRDLNRAEKLLWDLRGNPKREASK